VGDSVVETRRHSPTWGVKGTNLNIKTSVFLHTSRFMQWLWFYSNVSSGKCQGMIRRAVHEVLMNCSKVTGDSRCTRVGGGNKTLQWESGRKKNTLFKYIYII